MMLAEGNRHHAPRLWLCWAYSTECFKFLVACCYIKQRVTGLIMVIHLDVISIILLYQHEVHS